MRINLKISLAFFLLLIIGPKSWAAPNTKESSPSPTPKTENPLNLFDQKGSKEPTYVRSDTLTLNSKEHHFVYNGNVEVKQGDMTLTANWMEGNYNQNNQIENITAHENVVIVKGETIKATGEKAYYEKATDTVLLSDNPELQQNGSVLTADRVRIFLKENRSIAEGQVRVKILKGASGAEIDKVTKK